MLVRFAPGSGKAATLNRLEALPRVAALSDTCGLGRQFHRYLGLFYAFVGTMLVFAAALAFVIMFTAMSANIAERPVGAAIGAASLVAHFVTSAAA